MSFGGGEEKTSPFVTFCSLRTGAREAFPPAYRICSSVSIWLNRAPFLDLFPFSPPRVAGAFSRYGRVRAGPEPSQRPSASGSHCLDQKWALKVARFVCLRYCVNFLCVLCAQAV